MTCKTNTSAISPLRHRARHVVAPVAAALLFAPMLAVAGPAGGGLPGQPSAPSGPLHGPGAFELPEFDGQAVTVGFIQSLASAEGDEVAGWTSCDDEAGEDCLVVAVKTDDFAYSQYTLFADTCDAADAGCWGGYAVNAVAHVSMSLEEDGSLTFDTTVQQGEERLVFVGGQLRQVRGLETIATAVTEGEIGASGYTVWTTVYDATGEALGTEGVLLLAGVSEETCDAAGELTFDIVDKHFEFFGALMVTTVYAAPMGIAMFFGSEVMGSVYAAEVEMVCGWLTDDDEPTEAPSEADHAPPSEDVNDAATPAFIEGASGGPAMPTTSTNDDDDDDTGVCWEYIPIVIDGIVGEMARPYACSE